VPESKLPQNLRFKDAGKSTLSPPIKLYRIEEGGYINKELPDLLHFDFAPVPGKKTMVFHKYGGIKMVLEKQKRSLVLPGHPTTIVVGWHYLLHW
jgi:hypothetical protein